ncbi:MAG: DUF1987 domain-containing protein [Magnetococcales bacterium]|nr:DUF1987 domain-containing protein [Magnetococcales bacterium]
MKDLVIEATKSTPLIQFSAEEGVLVIRGESYPENAVSFYESVFSWLEVYFNQDKNKPITLDIQMAYFNSSSSKILMDLFDLFEESSSEGRSVTINWRYHEENEMALEYGEEFQEDLQEATFNLVSYTN